MLLFQDATVSVQDKSVQALPEFLGVLAFSALPFVSVQVQPSLALTTAPQPCHACHEVL